MDTEAIRKTIHDANGSLQVIVSFLETLEDESLSAESREDLSFALESAEALIAQLQDIRAKVIAAESS